MIRIVSMTSPLTGKPLLELHLDEHTNVITVNRTQALAELTRLGYDPEVVGLALDAIEVDGSTEAWVGQPGEGVTAVASKDVDPDVLARLRAQPVSVDIERAIRELLDRLERGAP